MSESMKPRFAVDLDEIERQLAQAQAAPGAPAPRKDPLSELARIVGQDDPFQSILANDRTSRTRAYDPSTPDDLFIASDNRREHNDENGAAYGLRGGFDHQVEAEAEAQQAATYHRYQASQAHNAFDPAQYDNYYAEDDRIGASHEYPVQAEQQVQAYERPRPRKGLVAIAVIVGFCALGVWGAMMLKGSMSLTTSDEPPLIKAGTEPVRVQPQSPGGVEIPNQNKQIYERAGNNTPTKVVNREEQPVDVRQAVRASTGADTAGGTTSEPLPIARQPVAGGLNLGEPRKVRTISIRPDGTVTGADVSASPPAAPPAPAASAAMTAPATTPRSVAAAPAPSPSVATPSAQAPRATAQGIGGSSPQPTALPEDAQQGQQPVANQAAPRRVATAQPVAVAPAPTVASSAAAPVGGFSVQLGVSSSEADAKTVLQRFQQKYPDLDGYAPLIRKAEVNGNTIYRVRVGPMAREEASSLCSKIQGQGGQCFVAKN